MSHDDRWTEALADIRHEAAQDPTFDSLRAGRRSELDRLRAELAGCDNDGPTCERCGSAYSLEYDHEPTPHCHPCAHEVVAELRTELAEEKAWNEANKRDLATLLETKEEVERLREDLAASNALAELAEAKEKLRDQAQQLDAARADNITYPRLLKEAHDERDAAIARAERAEKDLAWAISVDDERCKSHDAAVTERDAAREELDHFRACFRISDSKWNDEFDKLRAERDKARTTAAKTEELLDVMKAEADEEQETIRALRALLRRARDTMRTAARWLPRHEDIPDLSREIERLDCEINAAIDEGE
jgi:hypothetical protein